MKNTRQPYPYVRTIELIRPYDGLQDFAVEIGNKVAHGESYRRFKLLLPNKVTKELMDGKLAQVNALLSMRIVKSRIEKWSTKNTFVVQKIDE